jgi:hypothetical protein
MKTFAEFWKTIAQTLKSSPRQSPSIVTIPRNHIDENQDGSLDVPFKRDQHYFVVMISEMYLANERKWLNAIDPLVYVVSEFTYEGKPQVVPYLVGPAMMKRLGVPDQYADGIMFRNTNVSGVRPYRGGGLTLTIVLCEAKGDNYLRSVLQVVESTASALDFSPALSPYAKVASVVLDGFESLFNSGAVSPLVGLRDSFGPNFQIPFRPGYFALIDQSGVDPQGLWVRDKQLLQGPSLKAAEPYRQADYVLYSIAGPQNNVRDDVDTLPFNDLWTRVRREAASSVEDPNYKSAKAQMVALYQDIVSSPELTEPQADALAEQYASRMQAVHERAVRLGNLGDEEVPPEEKARLDSARSKSLAILKI